MDEDQHWRVAQTLHDVEQTLRELVDRDPDQEARGIAVPALDAVIDEAKAFVEDDRVLQRIASVVSPAALADGEPVRAADALVVVSILSSRVGRPEMRVRHQGPRTPYPGT